MSLECDYNQLETEVSLCEWHRWRRHYVHEIALTLEPNFKLESKKIIPHSGTWNILIMQLGRNNENICHKSYIWYWHAGSLIPQYFGGFEMRGMWNICGGGIRVDFAILSEMSLCENLWEWIVIPLFYICTGVLFPFLHYLWSYKVRKNANQRECLPSVLMHMEKGLKERNIGSMKFCLLTWRE
jgi:hypothetical protein